MRFASVLTGLAFAAIFHGAAGAQTVKFGPKDSLNLAPTDIERVKVGNLAPDFSLVRYGGGQVTLSDFRGKKDVVLVFFRGYWCPYCIAQLSELRTLLDPELKKSAELVVVSVDGDNENRQTVTRISRDGITPDFAFLTDSGSAVISRYGLLNPNGSRKGIPHPATVVVDTAGVVRWKFVDTDYKIRPSNEEVLKALRALRK